MYSLSAPSDVDKDYADFLERTIAKDVEKRLCAEECLLHPFLANNYVPMASPFATYESSMCM